HLAALQNYLSGFDPDDLAYDVLLHVGTLLSVLVYFHRDLWDLGCGFVGRGSRVRVARRLVGLLLLSTTITGIIFLFLGEWVKASFGSLTTIGLMFLMTGSILFATRWAPAPLRSETRMRWRDAIGVGAAQGLALLPGISRSGTTIAAALLLGVDRETAIRYSFLLSIPAILGAVLSLAVGESHLVFQPSSLGIHLAGAGVAALVGYGAIHMLLKIVRSGHLPHFAFYCWTLGAFILVQQTVL
ncbi:MAG: undecaprenyl-diphosphate phosphatase, partial [Acidobacteria bacterium]|nr:undecaprenyl-diphosphate phosphatase [Acidobacteriota bacterium]